MLTSQCSLSNEQRLALCSFLVPCSPLYATSAAKLESCTRHSRRPCHIRFRIVGRHLYPEPLFITLIILVLWCTTLFSNRDIVIGNVNEHVTKLVKWGSIGWGFLDIQSISSQSRPLGAQATPLLVENVVRGRVQYYPSLLVVMITIIQIRYTFQNISSIWCETIVHLNALLGKSIV